MIVLLLILITSCFGCSCDIPADEHVFRVLSYNVENLFDATLDGTEHAEYRDSKKWNERSYRLRLRNLGKILLDPALNHPDVIILQEIENERVVEDLLSFHLAKKGYRSYAVARTEGSPISVGAISRHPIVRSSVHAVPGGRNILEIVISTPVEEVVIFALHAKSQIGGFNESELLRIENAKSVSLASRDHVDKAVLVCGDFNQNPRVVHEHEGVQTALVDVVHPNAKLYGRAGSLLISGNADFLGPGIFYNPYLAEDCRLAGSYCYGGVWHRYDQILLSPSLFDRRNWEYSTFEVIRFPYLLKSDGTPKRWDLKTLSGYSDHLPVMVTLTRSPWGI